MLLLFSGEFLFVIELVLHSLVQQLKTALFGDQGADHSSVGLPLLFGFCVPVVYPEVVVWFKDRHLIDCKCCDNGLQSHADPGGS